MEERVKHYLGLNGLRAVAVTLVFILHKARISSFELGKAGVWLFFLISGFLIIGELHRTRKAFESGNTTIHAGLRTFFVKRALRIFPIYYVLLVILFFCRRFYAHVGPDLGFPWHFMYLSNFWMALGLKSWLGPFSHLWSLAVEQQFYLLAPFALLLTPSRTHSILCVSCVGLGFVGHVILYACGADELITHTISPFSLSVIAAGGSMYLWAKQGRCVGQSGLIAGLVLVCVFGSWPVLFGGAPYFAEAWFDLCLATGIALVLCHVVTNQKGILTKWLEWPPLNYLGIVSYGFYLFHNFIPNPLGKALQMYADITLPDAIQRDLGILCNYALTVIAASLSWYLIEKPILRIRQRQRSFSQSLSTSNST
jgi:peptidoglycan/LPS O-acetylase OafA/YrhL